MARKFSSLTACPLRASSRSSTSRAGASAGSGASSLARFLASDARFRSNAAVTASVTGASALSAAALSAPVPRVSSFQTAKRWFWRARRMILSSMSVMLIW